MPHMARSRPHLAQTTPTEPRGASGIRSDAASRPTYRADRGVRVQRFTNRELSRLDFGARLLDLAEDDGVPLLERVKFLAIFSELLDEFFQVRVAAPGGPGGRRGADPVGRRPAARRAAAR